MMADFLRELEIYWFRGTSNLLVKLLKVSVHVIYYGVALQESILKIGIGCTGTIDGLPALNFQLMEESSVRGTWDRRTNSSFQGETKLKFSKRPRIIIKKIDSYFVARGKRGF